MAELHISASLQMVNDKSSVLLTPQSPARGGKARQGKAAGAEADIWSCQCCRDRLLQADFVLKA